MPKNKLERAIAKAGGVTNLCNIIGYSNPTIYSFRKAGRISKGLETALDKYLAKEDKSSKVRETMDRQNLAKVIEVKGTGVQMQRVEIDGGRITMANDISIFGDKLIIHF